MEKPARAGTPTEQGPDEPSRAPAGPSPFLVIGMALAAGVALARWIDSKAHAHPLS